MKKILSFSLILLVFLSVNTFAQGELFNKGAAEARFGPVKNKIRFNSNALRAFLNRSEHLMFAMDKSKSRVNVLNKNRSPLFSEFEVISDDLYHVYDSNQIRKLLNMGAAKDTYIEQREDVLSISNGVYVLELALMCPPCCPNCPDWPDWPPED